MSSEQLRGDLAALALSLHGRGTVTETVDRVLAFARQAIGCDHAGVIFAHAGRQLETVAATDQVVRDLEAIQATLREGPDLSLTREDRSLLVTDTTCETRWPGWASAAAGLGLRSMVGARLYTSERTIGSLNLYDSKPCHFTESDRQVAHVLARHAAIALWNSQHSEHLIRAIDSRKLIGQAQGILMERFGLEEGQAFALLKRYSQDHNLKLHTVAETVVETRQLPNGTRPTSKLSFHRSTPGPDRPPA